MMVMIPIDNTSHIDTLEKMLNRIAHLHLRGIHASKIGRWLLFSVLPILLIHSTSHTELSFEVRAPEFSVFVSNSYETELSVEFADIEIERIDEGEQSFQVIRLPQAGWSMVVDEPLLPVIARLVAIPFGASVHVNLGQQEICGN